MKKTLKWLALAALALGLAIAFQPWTLWDDALRASLFAHINRITGLKIQASGRAVFALLPRPRIKIEDVSIADAAGSLTVAAPVLKGDIRLAALLHGQLQFDHAEVQSPRIFIDRAGIGLSWLQTPGTGKQADTLDLAKGRLGSFTLIDAQLRLGDHRSGTEALIDHIGLDIDWPQPGAPLVLDGQGQWQGQKILLGLWMEQPRQLLLGQGSAINLRASAAAGTLTLRGDLATGPHPHFAGNVALTATDQLQILIGRIPALPANLGAFALRADVMAQPQMLAMTGMGLSIGGTEFEGAAVLRTGEKLPKLSGTLATSSLQLGGLVAGLPPALAEDGHWSQRPVIPVQALPLEIDLRMSIAAADLGQLHVRDAAVFVSARDGKLELELAEANALQGALKGKASLSWSDGQPEFHVTGTFGNIDMSQLCAALNCPQQLSGLLKLTLALRGSGRSLAELARTLTGSIQASASNGGFSGLDISQALRRIEKRPLAAAADVRGGQTLFDSASLSANVTDGVLVIEDARLQGQALRLQMSGQASVAGRGLALAGIAMQTGTDGNARAGGPVLRFDLGGGWDALTVTTAAAPDKN